MIEQSGRDNPRRAPDDALIQHRADEHHALGTWNQVVIAVWRHETKLAAVMDLSARVGECVAKHRQGVRLLQIIEETGIAPGGSARRALAQMHGDFAAHIHRSALVYTKRGFAGAAVRAVMTGVVMVNPPRFAHELFAAIPDALTWIEQDLWPQANPKGAMALRSAVERLRAASAALDPAPMRAGGIGGMSRGG
jgi:hypothetical protein